MKDAGHHRSKLQKKVFREAKKHAMEKRKYNGMERMGSPPLPNIGTDIELGIHRRKEVPIIRTHRKRFH